MPSRRRRDINLVRPLMGLLVEPANRMIHFFWAPSLLPLLDTAHVCLHLRSYSTNLFESVKFVAHHILIARKVRSSVDIF